MSRKVEKYFPCILKKVKEEFETEFVKKIENENIV